MHGPINFESPNNTSKWQMGFNSAFKGLIEMEQTHLSRLLFSGFYVSPKFKIYENKSVFSSEE
jgi:hypothetical protein